MEFLPLLLTLKCSQSAIINKYFSFLNERSDPFVFRWRRPLYLSLLRANINNSSDKCTITYRVSRVSLIQTVVRMHAYLNAILISAFTFLFYRIHKLDCVHAGNSKISPHNYDV